MLRFYFVSQLNFTTTNIHKINYFAHIIKYRLGEQLGQHLFQVISVILKQAKEVFHG